jgi:Zn-dependent metalloprotease
MMKLRGTHIGAVLCLIVCTGFAWGQSAKTRTLDRAGIDRLMTATGGQASISINRANGTARFISLPEGAAAAPAARLAGPQGAAAARNYDGDSRQFLNQYSTLFGIRNPNNDLKLVQEQNDRAANGHHLTYRQYHEGVPVFGGMVKTHFDAAGTLRSINGTTVPNITLSTAASVSADKAAQVAVAKVNGELKPKIKASSSVAGLFVYQQGLAKGVDLGTHLVWQVVVDNKADVLEYVFIDAHTGKFVDQITGIQDGMFRRAYDGANLPTVPPSYPAAPYWTEGDAFPTASFEANNMITASQETYDFYFRSFGRDSFDGAGATMDSIFNRGYSCPNASWNGTFISFCPGFTTDDVTAHEWSHAYTQYTHGLIYAWQSGALNESYSDIWGETVDRINNRETDVPNTARTAAACSTFSPPRGIATVDSPAAIAGDYPAQSAQFGPPLSSTGVTGSVVLAAPVNGCTALTNAADVAGKIALIDRGTCTFVVKVKIAQDAGAIAVLVDNNVPAGLPGMGGADPTITIPSLGITQGDGNKIKAQLATGVTATLHGVAGTDNSVRWLLGEDVGNFDGHGALRDMSNPTCYANPGKVTDTAYYVCDTSDNGGVHTNSGIPNHAYALIVDGGTYNGQTISGIGFNKAAAIYWRAESVYQTPTTDFSDHADALEQSCSDLTGQPIHDIVTGAVSNEVISSGDCQQVQKAMLAVEMRTEPTQCNFTPLLAKTPPDRCGPAESQVNLFRDTFEARKSNWTVSHEAVFPSFTARDWQIVSGLPDNRAGRSLYGIDPQYGTCDPTSEQSGVLHVDSPAIKLPEGAVAPLVTFDHYVATERGFDGGNVKVSVDGGAWSLVPTSAFTYNPYNLTLASVAAGNTDPLAGQPAFSGSDGGSNSGSWGRSHVNLTGIAAPGQTVRLRYDMGTDGCGGVIGWFVDDVTLYSCVSNTTPLLSVSDASVAEGSSRLGTTYTDMVFTVTLDHASNKGVEVRYRTVWSGNAIPILDFIPVEGKLDFPPLTLTRQFKVKVRQDRIREATETFGVILSRPENAAIAKGEGTGTIVDDDTP